MTLAMRDDRTFKIPRPRALANRGRTGDVWESAYSSKRQKKNKNTKQAQGLLAPESSIHIHDG